jgi:uncharacterized cupredoxin-like copper-binding protein
VTRTAGTAGISRLGRIHVGAAALLGLGLILAVGIATGLARAAYPDRVEIHIHYSRFEPATLRVRAGEPVTFILVNDDPIDHEWILGDDAVQERHRTGTETHHDMRPTEVSAPALSRIETTVTFVGPVTLRYVCHLPGHEAYGMVGTLVVR